jgi:hypothetical protein
METLLKSQVLWQWTKTTVPDSKDEHDKLIINGKKDEAIGVLQKKRWKGDNKRTP